MKYHRDKDRITNSTRVYTKEGKTRGFQADPFAKKPSPQELFDDYQRFASMEKECQQRLRDTDRESSDILESREEEESEIQLKYSIYDVRKNPHRKPRRSEAKEPDSDDEKQDYIAIFITSALDNGKKTLNRETARQIVESCLKSYRERLQQKEKLLVSRYEKESKAIKKRQAKLSKKQQDMEAEEEEEHQRFIAEASFKTNILRKRLERVLFINL